MSGATPSCVVIAAAECGGHNAVDSHCWWGGVIPWRVEVGTYEQQLFTWATICSQFVALCLSEVTASSGSMVCVPPDLFVYKAD